MALIGLGAASVIAVGIGFAATYHTSDVDKATGCTTSNQAPSAHTLVLVDATDKLDPQQIANARSVIQTEYMWLPIGGQLSVRTITAAPAAGTDIVICRVDDGSKANSLTQNKKYARRRFDLTVGTKLSKLYAELENAPIQDSSPILETASAVFDRPDFGPNVHARRLVIISDLAQHSAIASDYGKRHAPSERALEHLRRDITGVKVRLHYVWRANLTDLQGRAHQDFWEKYFGRQGADVAIGPGLLIGEDQSKDTWIG